MSVIPYFKLRVIFHYLELGDFKPHIVMELATIFELVLRTVILTLRSLTLYIYGAPILDVSRSHTTTQHGR